MREDPGPLVDEQLLRRALRLDADEMPLRLDPVLIAAAASAPRRRSDLALAVVVAFAGGWVWSEAFRAIVGGIATGGLDPLAAAIDVVAAVAVRLAPLAETAMHPVIPIAILTAAVVAVFFEQRGGAHVASS